MDFTAYKYSQDLDWDLLKKLLPVFLSATTKDIIELSLSIHQKDYKSSFEKVHHIKGAVGGLGFMELWNALVELENSLRNHNEQNIRSKLQGVQEEWQELKFTIEENL